MLHKRKNSALFLTFYFSNKSVRNCACLLIFKGLGRMWENWRMLQTVFLQAVLPEEHVFILKFHVKQYYFLTILSPETLHFPHPEEIRVWIANTKLTVGTFPPLSYLTTSLNTGQHHRSWPKLPDYCVHPFMSPSNV